MAAYTVLISIRTMVFSIMIQGTGNWAVYQIFKASTALAMTQGTACVRLCALVSAFNMDNMSFTSTTALPPVPTTGKPLQKIEVEDFDAGGQGE